MKKLPPIAIIAIIWSITSIPIYQINYYGVSLPNYTLYGMLIASLFFGYFRKKDLNGLFKFTVFLVLALWSAECWTIFDTIFRLDILETAKSTNSASLVLFHGFLVFFLTFLALSPLLVGIFGRNAIKMAILVSIPALILTSTFEFKDIVGILFSLGLLGANLFGVLTAVSVTYFVSHKLKKMDKSSRGIFQIEEQRSARNELVAIHRKKTIDLT